MLFSFTLIHQYSKDNFNWVYIHIAYYSQSIVTNLVKLLEKRNLLLGLVLHLSPVLAKALKLVDKLINHIPEPLVGQLHVDDPVKHDLEEAAVVVPGVDPLLERGREPGVQVAEPHLAVEQAEDVVVVDEVGHGVHGWPGRVLEEPLRQRLERRFVHLVDLVHILLPDVPVQVHHERLHRVRHEVRVVSERRVWCLGLGRGWGRRVGGCVVVVEARHCLLLRL
jgi:hypothetical protein